MSVPGLDWPRVGLLPVVHALEAALAEGRGFSLIRLGDGEGAMLGHADPAMAEDLAFSWRIWFGDQVVTPEERAEIAGDLERAIDGADILGLPRARQWEMSPRYRAVFAPVALLRADRRPMVGDAALHFYLQWSGALGRLLRAARRVSVIGCRDVAPMLAAQGGISARQWLVRGEADFPGTVAEPHWPQGYRRVLAAIIADVEPGELVLVGAGVLGKAYGEAVRRRGGVAVDLGSVLDGWAGVMSRPGRITDGAEFGIGALAEACLGDSTMLERLRRHVAASGIPDATIG